MFKPEVAWYSCNRSTKFAQIHNTRVKYIDIVILLMSTGIFHFETGSSFVEGKRLNEISPNL